MRNVTKDTVSDAFMSYCSEETSPRLRFVLERLTHHLHSFAREVELTHEEWAKGIELLTRAGEITDNERNEFILFSDLLGMSSLVDMIHSPEGATSSSVLGPFHIPGAPELPVGGDMIGDNTGQPVVLSGRVTNKAGEGLGDAKVEIWQTADNGLYSNQDPKQSAFNLRARFAVAADGGYCLSTIKPETYTVPDDGPGGDMLKATGREPWRPAHLHVIVSAPGHRTLVTELFPADDPYLDEDPVFGVREDLIIDMAPDADRAALPSNLAARDAIQGPFAAIEFDFVLAPE